MRKDGKCCKCNTLNAGSGGYCKSCANKIARQHYHNNKKKSTPVLDLDGEIWVDIEKYEGLYMVSNMGRLKRLECLVVRKNATPMWLREKLMNPVKDRVGYMVTSLSRNNAKEKLIIHRAVAKAFIPNPLNKPEVNHINGVKWDNRASQLEWVSRKENIGHSVLNGFHKKGINSPRTIFSENQIWEIVKSVESERQLAKKYGVSRSAINCIRSGRSWSHLTGINKNINKK